MNYYCINISHSQQLKINISSELVEVQKRIRQKFDISKLPYGEISVRRNIRSAKTPTVEFPYGEINLRRNFVTAKFPYDEISYGEISLGEKSYGEISQRLKTHRLSSLYAVQYKVQLEFKLMLLLKNINSLGFEDFVMQKNRLEKNHVLFMGLL